MAITYSVSTNTITITAYTEAVPCNLTDLYNADKAGTLSLHARTGITGTDGLPQAVDRAERPADYIVLGGASNDLGISIANWIGTTATIRIIGTDRDGAAQTEDIVVTANGSYVTTKWFKTITHTRVAAFTATSFDYDLGQGQWGVVSKLGSQEFRFNEGVRLIIGDGSTLTWFGDTNKLIEISDLAGTGWQIFMEKKANANIRFGTIISGKRTKDGCAFYHYPVTNFLALVDANNTSGAIDFFSCSFYVNVTSLFDCSGLKMYNCGVHGDFRISASSSLDIYNHVMTNGYRISDNSSGDYDRVLVSDITYITYTSGTALTFKNVTARNNTYVARGYNTAVNINMINFDVDTWAFTYSGYTGKFYRQYEFDLKVIDKDNVAINTATVKVWDKDSNLIVDTTTNASGVIATQTITRGYYNQANGNTLQESSPHLIKIEKAGYTTYEADFTLEDKTDWTIALQTSILRNPSMSGGMV